MDTAATTRGLRKDILLQEASGLPSNVLFKLAEEAQARERESSDKVEQRNMCAETPRGTGGTLAGGVDLRGLLTHLFTYHPARSDQSPKYDAVNRLCIRFVEDMLALLPNGPGRQELVIMVQRLRMLVNQQIALDGLSVPDNI